MWEKEDVKIRNSLVIERSESNVHTRQRETEFEKGTIDWRDDEDTGVKLKYEVVYVRPGRELFDELVSNG